MKGLGVTLVLGCALALPAAARAEPISLSLDPSSTGVSVDPSGFSVSGSTIDLGTVTMDAGASGFVFVDGLSARQNYAVNFNVVDPAGAQWTTMTAEILDPTSDGFDAMDPVNQPSYVPAGFSTSNNTDGLSFAWNSGLDRSATFANEGETHLFVDEDTNDRDLISFERDGEHDGEGNGNVTFGLRDNLGDRGFLVRLSTDGDPASTAHNPEPATLLLFGTGLAGLVRRVRRQTA
jgi:PEP-CTERM motif-containing protein